MPALHSLMVPAMSLGAGGAGQQGGSAHADEGAGADWYLPSLRVLHLTDTESLTCIDAATLAERLPNAEVGSVSRIDVVFDASSDDPPEALQRQLRSVLYLDQRRWLGMGNETVLLTLFDFTASVQQLEHARQALCAPPGGTATGAVVEGSSGAGGSASSLVLANPVDWLQVRCEITPAHMAWLTAFMPCVRGIECSWDLLEALPDLPALPCLEELVLHNPHSMEDPHEAKKELAADVCAALGKLRVPPERVIEVNCGSVLLPEDLRLPAVCLAPHGLRLNEER